LYTIWERLRAKYTINEQGCWVANHVSSNGYGYIKFEGEARTGHSLLWEKMSGKRYRKSDKLELDHKCKNRGCWNPWHLKPATRQENAYTRAIVKQVHPLRDMITHCPQGHPYDKENTYIYRGARVCRECGRIKWR
jgi:HNH endonuclease